MILLCWLGFLKSEGLEGEWSKPGGNFRAGERHGFYLLGRESDSGVNRVKERRKLRWKLRWAVERQHHDSLVRAASERAGQQGVRTRDRSRYRIGRHRLEGKQKASSRCVEHLVG